MTKPEIGTLICGTLRTSDLLDALAGELSRLDSNGAHSNLLSDVQLIGVNSESEEAAFILEELFDALNKFAPEGCYFGAHWGDGADFGFWPADDID